MSGKVFFLYRHGQALRLGVGMQRVAIDIIPNVICSRVGALRQLHAVAVGRSSGIIRAERVHQGAAGGFASFDQRLCLAGVGQVESRRLFVKLSRYLFIFIDHQRIGDLEHRRIGIDHINRIPLYIVGGNRIIRSVSDRDRAEVKRPVAVFAFIKSI